MEYFLERAYYDPRIFCIQSYDSDDDIIPTRYLRKDGTFKDSNDTYRNNYDWQFNSRRYAIQVFKKHYPNTKLDRNTNL